MGKLVRKVAVAVKRRLKPAKYDPVQSFHSFEYQRHNARRQEHLASLGLPLHGRSVLETGAGIGDHTTFFLDRGCRVVTTEARQENLAVLRRRYPSLSVRYLDLDDPDPSLTEAFEVVYCYGLLYHLQHPEEALAYLAERCTDLLLLETCVSFEEGESIRHGSEAPENPHFSVSGHSSYPTREWVVKRLRMWFPFVYLPLTQPNHEQFPKDWTKSSPPGPLTRAVFIASRQPLSYPLLTESVPDRQEAAM